MNTRLFRIYANVTRGSSPDPQLCLAQTSRRAAEIVQEMWRNAGFVCSSFAARELGLPSSGREEGLVFEPMTSETQAVVLDVRRHSPEPPPGLPRSARTYCRRCGTLTDNERCPNEDCESCGWLYVKYWCSLCEIEWNANSGSACGSRCHKCGRAVTALGWSVMGSGEWTFLQQTRGPDVPASQSSSTAPVGSSPESVRAGRADYLAPVGRSLQGTAGRMAAEDLPGR